MGRRPQRNHGHRSPARVPRLAGGGLEDGARIRQDQRYRRHRAGAIPRLALDRWCSGNELHYQFSNGVHHSTAPGVVDAGGTFVADLTEIRTPRAGTGSSFRIEQTGADTTATLSSAGTSRPRWGVASTFYGPGGVIAHETDETGHTTFYESFDDGGQPQDVIDPRGKTWHYRYDNVENVTSVADPRQWSRPPSIRTAAYTTTLTYTTFTGCSPRSCQALGEQQPGRAVHDPVAHVRSRRQRADCHRWQQDHHDPLWPDGRAATGRGARQLGDRGHQLRIDAANRLIARVDPLGADGPPNVADQVSECTGTASPSAVSH